MRTEREGNTQCRKCGFKRKDLRDADILIYCTPNCDSQCNLCTSTVAFFSCRPWFQLGHLKESRIHSESYEDTQTACGRMSGRADSITIENGLGTRSENNLIMNIQ